MTIHEFIESRLGEDEETVRLHEEVFAPGSGMPTSLLAKMAKPGQLRAELVTKRRLLALHQPRPPMYDPSRLDDRCSTCMGGEASWPCKTIRAIATQYEHHPHFNEKWRA